MSTRWFNGGLLTTIEPEELHRNVIRIGPAEVYYANMLGVSLQDYAQLANANTPVQKPCEVCGDGGTAHAISAYDGSSVDMALCSACVPPAPTTKTRRRFDWATAGSVATMVTALALQIAGVMPMELTLAAVALNLIPRAYRARRGP